MKQTAFIENIAAKIEALGLIAPAVLLLEAHKPLAFLGSQLLLVAQPTLELFLPRHLTRSSIDLMADPAQLERLITSLESKTDQRRRSPAEIIATGHESYESE